MAKISLLPVAAPLAGDETLPIVQEGRTRRAGLASISGQFDNLASAYAAAAAGLANFRASRAEGIADFPVGAYFSSAETGDLRVYKRVAGAPFYEDQGDAAAPVTKAALGAAAAGKGDALVGSDDGAGGGLWTTLRGFVAYLRSSAGASILGTIVAGVGAVWRSIADKLGETVSVKDFGAACDAVLDEDGLLVGGTDDTAAIQAALDHCLSFDPPKSLSFPGLSKVTASLKIDRPVDTTTSYLHLVGNNRGGIVAAGAFPIFDTDLPATIYPVSESVLHDRMLYRAADADTGATVMSWKFLRVSFSYCWFEKIRVAESPFYLQDWHADHCKFRQWKGQTFKVVGRYFHCTWIANQWEHGEDGILSTSNGLYGSSVVGNLFEGSRRFFRQAGGNGSVVAYNYTELNTEPDYTFTSIADGGAARGTVFLGNQMTQEHGLFNVAVGDVRGFLSGGNYSNDKLFDMTATRFGRLQSIGDYAETAKFSRYFSAGEIGAESTATGIVAHAGGGQMDATPLTASINVLGTVAADGDSVGLPPTDDIAESGLARTVRVVNPTAHSVTVFAGAADFTNYGLTFSASVPAGEAASFIQFFEAGERKVLKT